MNRSQLERIRKGFENYSGEFTEPDGKLPFLAQLKFDHSMCVASNCRQIASELRWPAGELNTAEAVGILHDIGRYSQLREFRTYIDRVSIDHGERAYEVVRDRRLLDGCSEKDTRIVLTGIRYHNRKMIPPGLDRDELRFLRVVRDADKLDIIVVVNEAIKNNILTDYPEILLGVDPDGPPTPELVREIMTGGVGSYDNIHSLADINLVRTSWAYSINYLPTLRRISEDRLFDSVWESLPDTPEIRKISKSVNDFLARALAGGNISGEIVQPANGEQRVASRRVK